MNDRSNIRRVVVTGIGVVAPNGCQLDRFWDSLCAGESAAAEITRFSTEGLPTRIGCEVTSLNVGDYMDARKAKRFERSIRYGIAAAKMALTDSGMSLENMDPDRAGIVEGTSVSGMESTFKGQLAFNSKGYKSMSPFTLINAYCGGCSGEIALELGAKGHVITLGTGSASGNDAIGYALEMIARDEVDLMVAGGSEAPILAPLWGAFCLTRTMTKRNDDPKGAMRPFDRRRDGFLLGEGGAYLVLEELSHALLRGARIYAEVAGHGKSCEAFHSVAPQPEGAGLQRAMQKALRRAGMHTTEIDYINLHGTATDANDLVETRAVKHLFGDHARRVSVSSTKPVTGHLLGASGALESAIACLAIQREMIPPTINLKEPEEGCDLDYVTDGARPYPVRAAMNLSAGFGGKNSCLILRQYRPE